jgi:hypothetical protein
MRSQFSFSRIFLGACALLLATSLLGLIFELKNSFFAYCYFIAPVFWLLWIVSVFKYEIPYLLSTWILISGAILITMLNLSLPGVYGARGSDTTMFIAYLPLILPAVVLPKSLMLLSLQTLADKGGFYEVLALWSEAIWIAAFTSVIIVVLVKVLKSIGKKRLLKATK